MESQPQNPEFRKRPENFHPCCVHLSHKKDAKLIWIIFSEEVPDWPFGVDSLDLHLGGSTTVSFNVQKPQGTGVCKVSFCCRVY